MNVFLLDSISYVSDVSTNPSHPPTPPFTVYNPRVNRLPIIVFLESGGVSKTGSSCPHRVPVKSTAKSRGSRRTRPRFFLIGSSGRSRVQRVTRTRRHQRVNVNVPTYLLVKSRTAMFRAPTSRFRGSKSQRNVCDMGVCWAIGVDAV